MPTLGSFTPFGFPCSLRRASSTRGRPWRLTRSRPRMKVSARQMDKTPYFDVSLGGMRRKVRSGQGLTIQVQAVTPDLKPDRVIVPALNTGTPEQSVSALGRVHAQATIATVTPYAPARPLGRERTPHRRSVHANRGSRRRIIFPTNCGKDKPLHKLQTY
jgi:hypothetical protein